MVLSLCFSDVLPLGSPSTLVSMKYEKDLVPQESDLDHMFESSGDDSDEGGVSVFCSSNVLLKLTRLSTFLTHFAIRDVVNRWHPAICLLAIPQIRRWVSDFK